LGLSPILFYSRSEDAELTINCHSRHRYGRGYDRYRYRLYLDLKNGEDIYTGQFSRYDSSEMKALGKRILDGQAVKNAVKVFE